MCVHLISLTVPPSLSVRGLRIRLKILFLFWFVAISWACVCYIYVCVQHNIGTHNTVNTYPPLWVGRQVYYENFYTLIMICTGFVPCGSRMYGGMISLVLLWQHLSRQHPYGRIWHSMIPFCQIANTGISILTQANKLYLTDKGLRTNGRIYNLS